MPQNLVLQSTTPFSATIAWSGTSSNGYVVGITEQGANSWTYYHTDSVSYTFTGLASNTTYTCSVAADCNGDTSNAVTLDFTTQNVVNTTLTECTGIFTDNGGINGNYSDNLDYTVTIQPNGASRISITFNFADIEANYDTLFIYDGATTSSPLLKYLTGSYGMFTLVSSGGAMTFRFKSDGATTGQGWEAKWTTYGGDCNCIPVSVADSSGVWRTQDFVQSFDDVANSPLGIKERFYDVIYFENNRWTGNGNLGFFNENFQNGSIDTAIWTQYTGTWSIESDHLVQTDESLSNTNISAAVEQEAAHSYLYHWYMAMTGTQTNRRAGIYIFADDDASSNRGNSYMIWFRLDNNLVQIYKVHSDGSYDLVTNDPFVFNDGQWYDYKVYFNPQTGELTAYIDGIKASSWIDPSPYQAGHFISLRTGNAKVYYDDIKVYKSRGQNAVVTVGDDVNKAIRVQSVNSVPVARVKTMIMNELEHFSALDGNELKIDWTPPATVMYVYDGTGADIDTTFDPHQLSANWSSSFYDNSGIDSYWYAIGTTPGGTDVQDWMSNGDDTVVTASGFVALEDNVTYYFTVKAKNGAGLFSDQLSSDGQIAALDPVIAFEADQTDVCAGDTVQFINNTLYAVSYTWLFDGGTPASSTDENPVVVYNTPGTYDVTLIAYNSAGVNFALTQHDYITVYPHPVASFEANPQTLTLPDSIVVFTNNSQNATSYFWNFGDGTTSTDMNPYHYFGQPGDYTVTLIAGNEYCEPDTATIMISVVSDVDEANYNNGISISPNPASNYIYITANSNYAKNTVKKVEIVSADGKVIKVLDDCRQR
jgi:PKD repeat protein